MTDNSKITAETMGRVHLWLLMTGNFNLLLFILLPQLEQEALRKHVTPYTRSLKREPMKIGRPLRARKMPRCNKPEPRPTAE